MNKNIIKILDRYQIIYMDDDGYIPFPVLVENITDKWMLINSQDRTTLASYLVENKIIFTAKN